MGFGVRGVELGGWCLVFGGWGLGFGVWSWGFGVGGGGLGVGGMGFGFGFGFGFRVSGLGFRERFFALCAEGVVCGCRVLDTAGQARLMRLRGLRHALQAA